jgi:FKBP-type peptidyl-prolyl cis-trans isomerase
LLNNIEKNMKSLTVYHTKDGLL